MLEYFGINDNFNEKTKDLPVKVNNLKFHLFDIDKINHGNDKKIPSLIVFMATYEIYNDIIHAKFLVFFLKY